MSARKLQLDTVVESCASAAGISVEVLMGQSRQRKHWRPRSLALYILRERYGWTLMQLAEAFGRDHSTCRTACMRIESLVNSGDVDTCALRSRALTLVSDSPLGTMDADAADTLTKITAAGLAKELTEAAAAMRKLLEAGPAVAAPYFGEIAVSLAALNASVRRLSLARKRLE